LTDRRRCACSSCRTRIEWISRQCFNVWPLPIALAECRQFPPCRPLPASRSGCRRTGQDLDNTVRSWTVLRSLIAGGLLRVDQLDLFFCHASCLGGANKQERRWVYSRTHKPPGWVSRMLCTVKCQRPEDWRILQVSAGAFGKKRQGPFGLSELLRSNPISVDVFRW
jgi:hypothetical protein